MSLSIVNKIHQTRSVTCQFCSAPPSRCSQLVRSMIVAQVVDLSSACMSHKIVKTYKMQPVLNKLQMRSKYCMKRPLQVKTLPRTGLTKRDGLISLRSLFRFVMMQSRSGTNIDVAHCRPMMNKNSRSYIYIYTYIYICINTESTLQAEGM